jgi:hypothetical protein
MRSGIELRRDYDAVRLWGLAKATRDAGQSRRLLALAEIYDGGSRTKAAQIGGVGLQTLRDWVMRFNCWAAKPSRAPGRAHSEGSPSWGSRPQALILVLSKRPYPHRVEWRNGRGCRERAISTPVRPLGS